MKHFYSICNVLENLKEHETKTGEFVCSSLHPSTELSNTFFKILNRYLPENRDTDIMSYFKPSISGM